MEEKFIIRSTRSYVKALKKIVCVSLLIGIVGLIIEIVPELLETFWVTHYVCYGIGGLGLILLVFFWAIAKMEINVTDKRVYGIARFGKRVDLPLDSISAVSTGILKGIAVATSSGKIHFTGISNNKEIHGAISKLLMERQGKDNTTTIKQEIPRSNADELKKYKELLDTGVITQEEFDAKKKQLLGL